MTIIIDDPEIEAMIRRMADERGMTAEALVAALAREQGVPGKAYQDWLATFWSRFGQAPPEPTEPLPKSFFDDLSA